MSSRNTSIGVGVSLGMVLLLALGWAIYERYKRLAMEKSSAVKGYSYQAQPETSAGLAQGVLGHTTRQELE